MIEVNVRKEWILKQVVTKLGRLKINNVGDTAMSSNDTICDSMKQAWMQYLEKFDHEADCEKMW